MTFDASLDPQNPTVRVPEPKPATLPIEPVRSDQLQALTELVLRRPPAFWVPRVGAPALATFLDYAVTSRRAVVLGARLPGPGLAGYILAIFDVRRFWLELAVEHPLLAVRIAWIRAVRRRERRRELSVVSGVDARLPEFCWARNDRKAARIFGLLVHPDHRRRGVALGLYGALFEHLAGRGCDFVEEYMGSDYPEYAGRFPETLGFALERFRCGGYRISKALSPGPRPGPHPR